MSKGSKPLTGEDKAAILLFALGPEVSVPLIQGMDDATMSRLAKRMADLGKIESNVLQKVLDEYMEMHDSDDPMMHSSRKDVMALLHLAVDEDRANRILMHLNEPKKITVWEKLSRIKPEMIVSYIEAEHPQTIALVLGNLATSVASQVIALLPEDMQMSVVMRMSKIESVPEELVRDIEETLEKELSESTGNTGMSFDGMVSVVEILKTLDKSVSRPILERLEEKDEELFSQVDKLLLIFDDLLELEARDIQTILKHISSDDLVRALKGASEDLAESFFDNMSKRAAEIMREDMQVMGPLKLADVEDAQQTILRSVRKLDEDGSITLGGGDAMV
ncbi:MAG: flagellar motor switch protein FliG [Mariprofundaceae bacterium]|nr:flagellar motor switch protein FliG [Mariprofundaceae bacterium]